MAYRAFDPDIAELDRAFCAVAPATARFSAVESRVILLSDSDRADSLSARSRLGRLIDRLFGIRRNPPLADPRLETLRRFTVLARLADGRVPEAEIENFIKTGFTRAQAHALQLRAAASRIF